MAIARVQMKGNKILVKLKAKQNMQNKGTLGYDSF